jgi:hypothetical protein
MCVLADPRLRRSFDILAHLEMVRGSRHVILEAEEWIDPGTRKTDAR